MRLHDICRRCNIFCPEDLEDIEITGVSADSRRVCEGYAFVCVRGERHDGNSYIDEAMLHGARIVISERDDILPDLTLKVADARVVLARIANALCGFPTERLRFIAVTGTNGKTSVSFILKHIFDTLHIPCELIGTLNSSSFSAKRGLRAANFTTPDPEELYPMLRRIVDAGITTVIMEASSHALSQGRLEPIEFEVGVFTNLTEDHLDYHGTMEDYYSAKRTLFGRCGLGVINIDGEYGARLIGEIGCPAVSCSCGGAADYIATQVRCDGGGISYVLGTHSEGLLARTHLRGEFQVMNTLQAAAVAIELGLSADDVVGALETLGDIPGRLEAIPVPSELGFSVYTDYAHTPDALRRVLRSVRTIADGGRVVVVFGCGGDRERQKRSLMGGIAIRGSDACIITSDNPRSESPSRIIRDILSGIDDDEIPVVIPSRREAILFAIATARCGDVILLAGKGHEKYEICADGVSPFDEREVVCEAIEKIYGRRNE